MSKVDDNGAPAGPTMGAPGLHAFVLNGVTVMVDKDAQAMHVVDGHGQIIQLPPGAHFNAQKGTVDLPDGGHLTFKNGVPIRNTPLQGQGMLSDKYGQVPYTGPHQQVNGLGQDVTPTPKPVPNGVIGPVPKGHAPGSAPLPPESTPTPPPPAVTQQHGAGVGRASSASPDVSAAPAAAASSQAIAGGGNTHDFAVDVLKGLGAPVTQSNIQAIMAWSTAESKPGQGAAFNPMNTTQGAPGATNFNGVGVKNFTSYQQGVQATVQTLKNGNYGPILQAFQAGNDPFAVGRAVAASPWGTGQGVLNVLNAGHVSAQPIAGASSGGGYGPPVGAAGPSGTAGTAGATGPGTPGVPNFDEAAFSQALANAGFSSAIINSNLDLKQVFQQAVAKQQSVQDFLAAIQNTHWYQSRSGSQRQYDEDSVADHNSLSRRVASEAATITAQARQLGVAITPLRAHDLAVTALRNGLNPDELRTSLASEAQAYSPTGAYGGTYGAAVDQIKKSMADYNVQLDDKTIGQFAQQSAAGSMDATKIDEFLRQQAAAKYPWLKPQLDQGFTVYQLQSPYRQELANSLEVDPGTISNNDPLLQQGMQMSDGKGGYTTMPLYQFQQAVKQDPRWLKTDNARNSLMDVGVGVLRDMGLTS